MGEGPMVTNAGNRPQDFLNIQYKDLFQHIYTAHIEQQRNDKEQHTGQHID